MPNVRGFVRSPIGPILDALGRRYNVRPSTLAGMNPAIGESILFDIMVMEDSMQRENEARNTTGGNIKSKRTSWPSDIQDEIRRQRHG